MNTIERIIYYMFAITDMGETLTESTHADLEYSSDSHYISLFLASLLDNYIKTNKHHLYIQEEDVAHIKLFQIGFSSDENKQALIEQVCRHVNRAFKYELKYPIVQKKREEKRKSIHYPLSQEHALSLIYYIAEQFEQLQQQIEKNVLLKYQQIDVPSDVLSLALIYAHDMVGGHLIEYKVNYEMQALIVEYVQEVFDLFDIELQAKNMKPALLDGCSLINDFGTQRYVNTNCFTVFHVQPCQKVSGTLQAFENKLKVLHQNALNNKDQHHYRTCLQNYVLHDSVIRYINKQLKQGQHYFLLDIRPLQLSNVFMITDDEIKAEVYDKEVLSGSHRNKVDDLTDGKDQAVERKQKKQKEKELAQIKTVIACLSSNHKHLLVLSDYDDYLMHLKQALEKKEVDMNDLTLSLQNKIQSFVPVYFDNVVDVIPQNAKLI